MEKRPISELMETTMQKVREMIDANTIVGNPITTVDGITLIPVSKVSSGFAGGGSDSPKKQEQHNAFGAGIGAWVTMTPVAFAVVKGDNIKLLYIDPPMESTIDKLIDTVPGVLDKVSDLLNKKKTDEEAE